MSAHAFAADRLRPRAAAVTGRVLQRKCSVCGSRKTIGESCAACDNEARSLQRRSLSTGGAAALEAPPIVHEVLRSPGASLGDAARASFEPRFHHDFSAVRVHTDPQAAASARAVDAEAYTVGADIVFAAGKWNGGGGDRLLAHELAHVVQQSETPWNHGKIQIGQSNDAAEIEADAVSDAISRGNSMHPREQVRPRLLKKSTEYVGETPSEVHGEEVLEEGEAKEEGDLLTSAHPTVTLDRFKNKGPRDKDNKCAKCPEEYGVLEGFGANAMEIRGTVKNHQLGTIYDIKRTAESLLLKKYKGLWVTLQYKPPGTADDKLTDDESLIPVNGHIFSTDAPGLRHLNKIPKEPGTTEAVFKGTYEDYCTVQFGKSAPVRQEKTIQWHSISWYERSSNGSWQRKAGLSEISLGSIKVGSSGP